MKPLAVQDQRVGIPRNPYYEQDVVYVFKPCKWILKSIGIWPDFLEDTNKLLQKLAVGLWNLVLLFALIPFTLYLALEKDLMIVLSLIALETFCWISVFKYWSLIACRPTLKYCIESIQDDWKKVKRTEDRDLMLKYGNVGRNLTIICLVLMYSCGFIYHTIVQYAVGTFIDAQNRTIKPLVYPTYIGFFDPQESPFYEIMYAVQSLCGYVVYSVTICACALVAVFSTHVCGQIDIIILRLQNLANEKKITNLRPRLVKIVKHHIRTLKFSATVETTLQQSCFLEFLGSTFLICMVEYYTITNWKVNDTVRLVTYFMILLSLMFNIFILCYIGDLLVEKTGNVGALCFMIDWYHFPVDTIRSIILMICISNFPAKITAGPIADLNMTTFGKILKSTLAYLSFLRSTVE
ncbi:odorant receptor 4-like isoform X1 [Megalopta genalis]|uniref:odorant receptor 4-like isoform X1 n=1 Tax=Megalopta genalis TaxID=115081 RepID=UPI003FD1980D